MDKFKYVSKDKISQLPKSPGVYCFKNKKIFYIGKATNIKERVKNHFQQPAYQNGLFLNKVKKIGYIKTNSEIEALILEANLIKKYQPKYNVVWRDDKNYFFVGITKEECPRVFITHQPKPILNFKFQISNFTGPFVDGKSLKQTLKFLRKVFPYRTCKALPKRPCLWYQLSRCPAPCLIKSNLAKQIPNTYSKMKKECQRNAKNLVKILQKGRALVLKDLKKGMKKFSALQDFEGAAKTRDQIRALERVMFHARIFEFPSPQKVNWLQVQKILQKILKLKKTISRIEAYDVSNIQGQQATGSMITFINGQLDKNFYRKFKIKISGKPNDLAMIKEVLSRRFKHKEWSYPDLILIDGGKAQLNAARKIIKCFKDLKVIALAKKKNQLYIENQKRPVFLKNLPREIFNLILQLRDEAHRFARKYHLKLRTKSLTP